MGNNQNKLTVLSLFDGLSGAQMALKKLGVVPKKYFASEIDKYAIKIAMKNFPNTIQLGDVIKWKGWNLPKINLLIGGSPCQDLSSANNNGKGLDGARSGLFWVYVDILNALKPRYFVLENVESMKTKDFVIISNALGVEPIMLDAALVSAQRRKRFFWTNIPNVKKPQLVPSRLFPNSRKGLVIADILEENAQRKAVNVAQDRIIKTSYGVRWNTNQKQQPQGMSAQDTSEKSFSLVSSNLTNKAFIVKSASHGLQRMSARNVRNKSRTVDANVWKSGIPILIDHNSQQNRAFETDGKFGVLPAARTTSKTNIVFDDLRIEQLTWTELERLAGLPDGFTDLGDENRVEPRGRAIGNGFQIDIVAHLLSFMLGFPEPLKRSKGIVKAEQLELF